MANIARLKELLKNVVPYIRPEKLSMGSWSVDSMGNYNAVIPNGCGTAACLAGWACVEPSIKRQGLRFEKNSCGEFVPTFHGRRGFNALERFYELGEPDADHIFGSDNSDDPVEAAQRIIDVIEANTP